MLHAARHDSNAHHLPLQSINDAHYALTS